MILEALALLALAGLLGTGFHLLRRDPKLRIPFIGKYERPFEVLPPSKVTPPKAPAQPVSSSKEVEAAAAPEAAPPQASGAQSSQAQPPPAGEGPGREILVDQAFEEFQNGTLFIDARRTKHYEEGHIPGARSLSIWEADFDERFDNFRNDPGVAIEMPIVVYCMSVNCEDSHRVAERLKGAGFQNILVFRGGLPEWVGKKHPVETGPEGAKKGAGGEEGAK